MAGNPSIIVEYIADVAKLVAGTKEIAASGDQAGKSINKVDWGRVAKFAGGAAAIGAGVAFIKGASDATNELVKSTMGLQRATNLDTRTASAWISVLQTRGIEAGSFQTALGRLSKQMETSRTKSNDAAQKIRDLGADMAAVRAKGGKDMEENLDKLAAKMDKARDAATKARGPFGQLGIDFQKVKSGDVSEVILQAADAISKMENPAKRAAAAQALFGKQGLKLLPILMQGRKGIEDNLKTAEKYGATVGDKQVEQTKKVAAAQRELALAHKGVQVAIGSALIPAQAELMGSLLGIVNAVLPFTQNINVMKVGIVAVAVAMGVLKVATIASTIAQLGLNMAMLPTIGIVAGIVVGIAALIAIGILLYKNWDTIAAFAGTVWGKIKDAAMAAFNWIKSNWPLLLPILFGPIGIAAAIIIRYWGQIKAGVMAALNAIKSAVTATWNAIVGVVTTVGNAIRSAVVGAWNAVKSAVSAAIGAIRSVVSAGLNALAGIARAAWNAVVAVIRGAVGKAGAAARAVVTAIKSAFTGAGTWLVNAGKAVVQGLINGLQSMAGALGSAVKGLANKLTGGLAGHLGLGSPSRITHQYGVWVAEGLANGITAGTPKATAAARKMAKATMDAAQATIQSRASTLGDYLSKAFQARQAAVKTPAELALQQMQEAHDEAGRQKALADAQAQMASAKTDEERLSAQQAYADASYAIQVAALQKTADAERLQLDSRQGEEQRAFDNSLKALQNYLGSAHATAAGARTRINALMAQYGLDFGSIGKLLGDSFAAGLTKSISQVTKAATKLANAVKAAVKAGLKIGSPSKVMQGYGAEVSRGLALGINRHSGLVSNALGALMPTSLTATPPLLQASTGPVSVRVFIGDTELRGMVRTEIANDNSRVARRLLAGGRA